MKRNIDTLKVKKLINDGACRFRHLWKKKYCLKSENCIKGTGHMKQTDYHVCP